MQIRNEQNANLGSIHILPLHKSKLDGWKSGVEVRLVIIYLLSNVTPEIFFSDQNLTLTSFQSQVKFLVHLVLLAGDMIDCSKCRIQCAPRSPDSFVAGESDVFTFKRCYSYPRHTVCSSKFKLISQNQMRLGWADHQNEETVYPQDK